LAGFLFSNPAYADPPPLEALAGETKTVDSGTFSLTSTPFSGVLSANGGTITTAPPGLTLDAPTLQGADVRNGGTITITDSTFNVLGGLRVATGGGTINATNLTIVLGPGGENGAGAQVAGSTITLQGGSITSAPGSVIQSTGVLAESQGTLTAEGTSSDPFRISGSFRNSAQATNFGSVVLKFVTIEQNHVSAGPAFGALETATHGTITADHVMITTGTPLNRGAFAQGGLILLTNSMVTTTAAGSNGVRAEVGIDGIEPGALEADNTVIMTSGPGSHGALAVVDSTVILRNNSTVTTTGALANGIYSYFQSTLNCSNSTVTALDATANGGQVADQSVMNITNNSKLTGGANGIRVTDDEHDLGPSTLNVSGSTITATAAGAGEAAFRVDGAKANITLNSVTVNPGAQNLLLNVTSTDLNGDPFGSVVNFTVNPSTLNGDILVDAKSMATVSLQFGSTLNGAVNENQLTGAAGINPTGPPQINPLVLPVPPPQPLTVNLDIDSTSTWNMRASSTINTLTVKPQAHVNFPVPPAAGQFKTLLVNNLGGTGGIFHMNVDLGLIKGDLIDILSTSEGEHLLTFVNRNQGSDLPVNTALLVVRTPPPGGAGFTGETDGGTFKYFVVHGDGSSVTPVKNDWYLVRGDAITPPQVTPPPPTNPNPSPTPAPPVLPLPPEVPTGPLSPSDDLTNTANAAIGTYSSTIPLFYADMQTLVERMGELRLGIVTAPAPAPVPPTTKEGGKGVVESKEIVAPPPPPTSEWGVWIRGFGNGMRINNDVSRRFDQDVGGFQIGADKRVGSLWSGDVYLGVFGSYIYASRDFRDGGDGSSNAFSLGGYATWIHPQGWYVDIVGKYTQMWNYFNTPTAGEIVSHSTGYYNIPTVGGSLELGKRFDFADHSFFIEPQAQLAGCWEDSMSYTASNGLHVHGDDQTSLQGRLGGRVGMHFDLSQGRAVEPYAKAEVIEEFLTGNTVTTDITGFNSSLSGTVGRFGAGLTARLSQSAYIYAEYDYATGDHIQAPWSVSAGLRWQW
jgi:outer membrane autotransporter protein